MSAITSSCRPSSRHRRRSSTCQASPGPSAAWRTPGTISTSTVAAISSCSKRFARSIPARSWCVVGSRLQYGKPARLPAAEEDLDEALCLHAIHKRTAEQYLQLYRRLFGLRYAIARVTNPYGPGQPSGRTAYGIINRWIHLALADEPLTVYGDGAQQRDYIHVDDVVAALMVLGDERRKRWRGLQRRQRHRHADDRRREVHRRRRRAAARSSGRSGRRWPRRSRPATSSLTCRRSRVSSAGAPRFRSGTGLNARRRTIGRASPREHGSHSCRVSRAHVHGRRRRGDGAQPGAPAAGAVRADGVLHPLARPDRRGDPANWRAFHGAGTDAWLAAARSMCSAFAISCARPGRTSCIRFC